MIQEHKKTEVVMNFTEINEMENYERLSKEKPKKKRKTNFGDDEYITELKRKEKKEVKSYLDSALNRQELSQEEYDRSVSSLEQSKHDRKMIAPLPQMAMSGKTQEMVTALGMLNVSPKQYKEYLFKKGYFNTPKG